MWLCCAVSYMFNYLALCLAVSYISLFRELNISPVINIDVSVPYPLKFRLMAFVAYDIQKEDMTNKTTCLNGYSKGVKVLKYTSYFLLMS